LTSRVRPNPTHPQSHRCRVIIAARGVGRIGGGWLAELDPDLRHRHRHRHLTSHDDDAPRSAAPPPPLGTDPGDAMCARSGHGALGYQRQASIDHLRACLDHRDGESGSRVVDWRAGGHSGWLADPASSFGRAFSTQPGSFLSFLSAGDRAVLCVSFFLSPRSAACAPVDVAGMATDARARDDAAVRCPARWSQKAAAAPCTRRRLPSTEPWPPCREITPLGWRPCVQRIHPSRPTPSSLLLPAA